MGVGVYQEPPKSIKPQEWGMYNPAWVDCSVDAEFEPLPNDNTFRYLWVVKFPDRLIMGIEFDNITTLKRVLTSYGFSGWLAKCSDTDLEKLLKLGHPTLSAHFTDLGAIVKNDDITAIQHYSQSPTKEYGGAFYGGELNYVDGGWVINNHSGRHSGKKKSIDGATLSISDWVDILEQVRGLFYRYLSLPVTVDRVGIK